MYIETYRIFTVVTLRGRDLAIGKGIANATLLGLNLQPRIKYDMYVMKVYEISALINAYNSMAYYITIEFLTNKKGVFRKDKHRSQHTPSSVAASTKICLRKNENVSYRRISS